MTAYLRGETAPTVAQKRKGRVMCDAAFFLSGLKTVELFSYFSTLRLHPVLES
jgi:hypothetical protein